MASGVVDHLEAIQVDEAQGMLGGAGLGLLPGGVQFLLELQAVEEAGKGVVGGVVAQFALQVARMGDVLEYQHRADDAAIHRAHRRCGILYLVSLTVPAEQHGAFVQRGDGLVAQAAGHRAGQDRIALAVVDEKHLFVGPPLGVRQRPAGQLLGDRIEKEDATVHVGGQDGVGDGGEGDLQSFLFFVERRGQPVVLGDVAVAADHAAVALAAFDGDHFGEDPALDTVRTDDAEFVFVGGKVTDRLAEEGHGGLAILRMQGPDPGRQFVIAIDQRQSVELMDLGVGDELTTAAVPLPDADVAGANRQLQALAQVRIDFIGAPLGIDITNLQQITRQQILVVVVGRTGHHHP